MRRFHFVDASGSRIRRRVVVQDESILDGVDEWYRWRPFEEIRLGGFSFSQSTLMYSVESVVREEPGLEADHTRRFLRAHGYEPDDELVMARFAAIVDPRRELLVFYEENWSDHAAELDAAALLARGLAAFDVRALDVPE